MIFKMKIKLIWIFIIISNFNLIISKLLEINTDKKSINKAKNINKQQIETINESILNEIDCSNYLKQKDGNYWVCKMEFKKNKPHYCSCNYQYDCSTNNENFKFYFSSRLLKEIKIKNKLNNINRGADYQCEIALNNNNKNLWKCSIIRNKNKSKLIDEEFYCECFYKKTCTNDHFLFLY